MNTATSHPYQALVLVPPHHSALNQVAAAVPFEEISSEDIQALIAHMLEIGSGEQGDAKRPTMVGLAAPQLGVSLRIILVAAQSTGDGKIAPLDVFINPTVVRTSDQRCKGREGCYSTGSVWHCYACRGNRSGSP